MTITTFNVTSKKKTEVLANEKPQLKSEQNFDQQIIQEQ
jgi:hypothetical protein